MDVSTAFQHEPKAKRWIRQRDLSRAGASTSSKMNTPGDVVRVLLHESLGHFGLRGMFGDELKTILKQVAALRNKDVTAKAKQYGLDMNVEKDRLIAAEEVLAELAQTNPKIGFVQRAIAAIRKWLRENVEDYKELKLTDGEIISNYIVPAREFVQQGRTVDQGGLAGAFSRDGSSGIESIVASFAEKVREAIKAGQETKRQLIPVADNSPASLQMLGFRNLPVVARAGADGILKMFYDHGMTADQIGRLIPETLNRPAFIFQHKGQGGFESLIFVAQEERGGKPIIVAVHPERKGQAASGGDGS